MAEDLECRTDSAAATEALAAALGALLLPGDRILLQGGLGAGKTTFTRGLVRGAGHPDARDVASPTFALHHRYEGGVVPIDHLDLYRIEDSGALERHGVLDPLDDPGSVTVIEWAERLPAPVPGALKVLLDHVGEDERILRFFPVDGIREELRSRVQGIVRGHSTPPQARD